MYIWMLISAEKQNKWEQGEWGYFFESVVERNPVAILLGINEHAIAVK